MGKTVPPHGSGDLLSVRGHGEEIGGITMRRRGRKWLSLLLALCMVVTMLPAMSVPAAAAATICTGIHDSVSWSPMSGEFNKDELSPGNYYLTGDVTVTMKDHIQITGNVTLCLNGHKFNLNKGGFAVNGGSLTLCDCKHSGSITDCTGPFVVSVSRNGTFHMFSGSITGNHLTSNDNSSTVIVEAGSTFNMYGGSITGNTADDTVRSCGGVLVFGGTFNMSGGAITGNTAAGQALFGSGGGVFVESRFSGGSSTFTVSGSAVIRDNTAKGSASNVLLDTDMKINIGAGGLTGGAEIGVTMEPPNEFTSGGGASYRQYFFSDNDAYVVVPSGGELMLGQLANYPGYAHSHPTCGDNNCSQHGAVVTYDNSLTAMGGALGAGNYYMKHSVTATDDITISGDVNLCLNGKTLDLNGHHFIVNSGGSLTLCDCMGDGQITGGAAAQGGAVLVNSGGSLTLHSGAIAGNTASGGQGPGSGSGDRYGGGAVCVNGGSFTMTGGSIEHNTASVTVKNDGGGGVLLNSGTFEMTGGNIARNSVTVGNAATTGGGVYVNSGAFTMTNGTISNNSAPYGGGVTVFKGTEGESSFTLSGGSITDNTATGTGGGVYVAGGAFTLSGAPVISGNSVGSAASNIYLHSSTITLSGTLSNTAPYGVSMASPDVFTSGGGAAYIENFTSDDSKYKVIAKDGELCLTSGYTVIFNLGGAAGTAPTNQEVDQGGKVTKPTTDPTWDGHTFAGWYNGGTLWNFDTVVTANMTLTAKWITNPTVTVSGDTSLTYGTDGTLTANVTNAASGQNYAYQWYSGGSAINGATGSSYTVPATTPVGSYTYSCTVTASITGSSATASADSNAVTVTVSAKDYESGSFTIDPIGDQTYTGSQIKPDVTVKFGGTTLAKGTDYDLEYGTNTAAGDDAGSVTINFKGNYSGSATVKFNIVYAEFPGGTSNDTVFEDYTDTSNNWSNSGSVTFETQDDWTVSTSPNGDYEESVTFDDKQDGEHTETVYVKDSSGNIYETEITYKLDKTAPQVSDLTADKTEWTADGVTVSFDASDATAGIDSVTVKKPDGTTETLTGSGGDYSFTADSNGAYTVTVTDNAGNTTTQEITISNIDKTTPGLTVTGGDTSGEQLTLSVTATPNGGSGVTVTVKQGDGEAETITGSEYTITAPGAYTFTATTGAGVTTTVTKTVHSIAFDSNGGSSVDRQLVVSGGKVTQPTDPTRTGYTFDCWQSGQNEWNFGSQVTTNLTLTAAWTLNVPTVTLNADKNNVTYGECITLTAGASHAAGNGIDFTYEWYKDGTKLNGKTASTLTLENVADSGEYKVVVTARDKNGLTATAEDTVNVAIGKATPTLTVSAAEITYGQSLSDSRLTGTAQSGSATVSGSFAWQSETTKPVVADSDVTEYTVVFTPDDTANYTSATTKITLTVNRKVLTPTINTVADKTYDGNTATTGTIALSGAVGTENPTATGVFTFVDANAGANKPVDVTGITLDENWGANYALSVDHLENQASSGSIAPRPVVLSWSQSSFTYDGQPYTVTAEVENKVGDDTFDLKYTGNTQTAAGDNYTATVTSLGNANYTLAGGAGLTHDWVIHKAVISFTVSGNSHIYDNTAKTATVTQTESEPTKIAADKYTVTYGADNAADKTDAGTYDITVTISDPNFCFEGGTASKVVGQLTIGKKAITGTWTDTKQVYEDGGSAAILPDGLEAGDSADDIHYHYTGTTADGTIYNSDELPTEAGTYTITASADNYEITNGTATLVIEKKPVTVTVTDNAVIPGGKPTINAPDLTEGKDYTVTYKDKDGNVMENPTQPGTYEVWVEFENPNYRHSDGSTDKQVGSFTIAETQPAMYTVTFDGKGKTSGTMPDLELAGGSVLTLPVCDYVKTGHQFTGWLYGGKIYQPGDQVTAAYGDMTFAAQWQAVFTVSGTVTEKTEGADTPEVKNAVVSLWLGANKINETSTNENGSYSFDNLIPGIYNLVVSKDERTVTSMVEITTEDRTCNAVLPQYVTNSIVDVTPGSPDIVVGNLDEVFHDTNGADYTEDDAQNVQQNGGKVEITFTVDEQQENDVGEETVKELQSAGGGNLSLFLDCTLTKVVTDQNNGTTETELSQSSVLLEILLPLPAELQGKYSYTISRMHDGKAQIVPQGESSKNEDGEYFTVSEDKTVLVLHVKNFSIYAVGYRNAPSTPTYPPVKNESENGSYTVSPSSPSNGEKVTITPKPDEGYVVGSVTVTDKNGRDVAVTPNTDGTYTFTQPSGSVTITVTFRKDTGVADCPRDETCPMAAFVDLNPNAWYHDGVHYCLEEELMNGVGSGAFAPNGTTSRAMIATILWRLEGSPVVNYLMTYEDVDQDQWYTEAVRWAASVGVVTGYSSEAFGPDDPITREQLAAMLYRYAVYKGYDVRVGGNTNILSYSDASEISEYAVSTIQWACGAGIINGIGNGQLDPKGSSTRAQAATMLMRFCVL